MDDQKKIADWVNIHFKQIREDLFELLRFKTISADPAMKGEQAACAAWLKNYFQEFGCLSEVIQTPGLPLVYAEDLRAGPHAPTLLIYGHYDVQPIDPIELWQTDPFQPTEKNGVVFARGAVDDKGQIFYAVAALRAIWESGVVPLVNIKFCIEGEEEYGSAGLQASLPSLQQKLSADYLLVVDFDLFDADTPALNLGARGIVTLEVLLRGSATDLHSGLFGGIAYNPNRALSELLAQCWDEKGRIRIPHFYEDVAELSSEEKRLFAQSFKEEGVNEAEIYCRANKNGLTFQEASWFYPTLEINGINGGYTGPGFKTVIPAEAKAHLSCRLVPHQDPEKIGRLVADFLKKSVKGEMQIQIKLHEGGKAYRGRIDSPLAIAVERAYEKIFHKKCKRTLSGGSIPVIANLMHAIQADVVGMGYGLPQDNIHAPNEHFSLDRFKKGLLTVASLIGFLGEKNNVGD